MNCPRKLCVVHIITKLELGGAQKVCLSLVKALPKKQIDTYLITGSKGTIAHQVQNMSNVFLLPFFKREIAMSYLWLELKTFITIVAILRTLKKKHQTVMVHTHCTKAGLLGRWAAFFAGIKTRIHTIHGYGFNPHQSRIAWTITYLLELITSFVTTHYVCVSSQDVKTGIRLFPGFSKKHSIIRAAIDWQQFYTPAQQTNWPTAQERPFIFGTVSGFTQPGKNIPELLRAFLEVHKVHQDIRLEIIGGGILQHKAEEWVALYPEIQDKVTFWGWQEEIAPIMKRWHAFVFSSLWEGMPCAIVEARMLKLPILSYNTGGISDVVINGENGFLYPQKQWQLLSAGMQELLENPSLYTKLRTFNDILDEFNDATMIKRHHKLYRSLTSP